MTQLLSTEPEVSAGLRSTGRAIPRHPAATRVLVGLSVTHAVVLLAWPSALTIGLGLWWCANTVSHYFVHRPFFRSAWANSAFSLWLSALLLLPQSIWRDRHLAHHAERPVRIRRSRQLAAEVALVSAIWIGLLLTAPEFFAFGLVPGVLLGLLICAVHGHYEHVAGTTSHYGWLYNLVFLSDGYHVEHHRYPNADWRSLPQLRLAHAGSSRWPAVLRFLDSPLDDLERLVFDRPWLQRLVLDTHRRAWRRQLEELPTADRPKRIGIVGGGLFPRSALLLRELLPDAELTLIDASAENLELARARLGDSVCCENAWFDPSRHGDFDLLVFPLAYRGDDKAALRRELPAPMVVFHEWLFAPRENSVVVSPWLFKRMNLHRRASG